MECHHTIKKVLTLEFQVADGIPGRQNINMSKRGKKSLSKEVGIFLKRYARTSRRPGLDPNDRHYDHKVERILKRMKPEELDRLINEGDPP